MFWREYIERIVPWQLEAFETVSRSVAQSEKVLRSAGGKWEASQATKSQQIVQCRARLLRDGKPMEISGQGNGPLAALVHGFITAGVPRFEIVNYSEHALGSGEEASAISYIQIKLADGKTRWGAGVDTNIELASIRAVLSALNRS
jgi:2-isopropylmalate synthase